MFSNTFLTQASVTKIILQTGVGNAYVFARSLRSRHQIFPISPGPYPKCTEDGQDHLGTVEEDVLDVEHEGLVDVVGGLLHQLDETVALLDLFSEDLAVKTTGSHMSKRKRR